MSTLIPARNTFGAVFKYSSVGSSANLAACANIISITPPNHSRGVVDVTNWGTTDFAEQAIASGIKRTGNVGITAVWLSSNEDQITTIPTDFLAGTRCGWSITVPGSSAYNQLTGDGFITSYNYSMPQDGMVGFDMTIKVTGKPVLSSTTSI